MLLNIFSNQFDYYQNRIISWIIVLFVFSSCILNGCAPSPHYTTTSILSPGDTSIQLLNDRSIGVLHDRLTIFEDKPPVNSTPKFTILNRTVHSLTVELTGTSGSYTFVLEPKRDQTWLVNPGTYHVEISVPGFPTTAADSLQVNRHKKYKWELWKTKH